MKRVTETFTYEVPDDCDDYVTIQDYVDFVDSMTCPFYDGMEQVPDNIKHTKDEILI